ncbi:MAG: hypothetical protein L6Q75_19230 [Burkholderiaceae bacterium]|nr:hypothetical protein [Burkholderiaceae bacterium]
MSTHRPLTLLAGALAGLCLGSAALAQTSSASGEPSADSPRADARTESALAADTPRLAWSGFGTLGWARSNRSADYQRFIDRQGGLERDSLLGGQIDAQLSARWSATLQARLAPSDRQDNAWDLRTTWAFVAWRPDNDWLIRAGKLRVPFFLRSEHLDVGSTYTEARLPAEVYTMVPTNDFQGLHLSRSWELADGELSLDAYRGKANMVKRVWMREGMPGQMAAGVQFRDVTTTVQGLVATYDGTALKWRLGGHRARTEQRDGGTFVLRPAWAPLGPGIGYWQTHPALPGPGVEVAHRFENTMLTLGAEWRPRPGWMLAAEYGRIRQVDTERSLDSTGGYLTVSRDFGRLTPYLTWSRLFSSPVSRRWARTLDETTVPAMVPGSTVLNASMRAAADSVPVYDQHAWAFGAAFALSPTHKLKAEWLHTRAEVSSMFDLAPGEKLFRPRSIDVLSVNYSFTF